MLQINKEFVLAGLATAVVSYFSYYTFKIYLLRQKYKHIPGPPANGILGFYFGNLFEIKEGRNNDRILFETISRWVKKYGTTIKYQMMDKICVFTTDLEAIREILIDSDMPKLPMFYKLFGYPYGIRSIGNGLVTDLNVKRWKHRRALFNPSFHKHVLNSFIEEFNNKGDLLLEKLRLLADGKTKVVMLEEFNHATLDAIATIAFGMESNTINDPSSKLNKYVTESLKGFFKYFLSQISDVSIVRLTKNFYYKNGYAKIIEFFRQLGRNQIESRLKLIKEGSYIPNDLLTITLKSYENESFDMEDMIDDFITFFIAGQETTANTLSFVFLELARNPLIFQKLREEIDRVFGSRETIRQEDLAELKYTSCVIKETLRLWPVAPGLNRLSPESFYIDSFKIPSNSWIQVSPYVTARHEEYFPDCLNFKPDRFSKENNNEGVKAYSYFPFSLGPRNCIGQNFAQTEMKVLIAKLVKNFDFELVPGQNLTAINFTTLRPIDGTICILKPRKT